MITIITLWRALRSLSYLPLLCIVFFLPTQSKAQGRILINEFLPWPNNTCGTTAEFIELFNFGPGPVNISGYIVTDGDYAITIPANTIVTAGSFYVLAGQNTIPQNCGNDLRDVTANLNWNTCGCTSAPIPTSGDGFMTDGGGANEQILLLDPQLQVIDAVIRSLPAESSSLITTSTVGGQFPAHTFDLDLMSFTYETIGESLGRGNSMARRVDGGCGWIKDTQESAGDINNTSGIVSELAASLNITHPIACSGSGSVAVSVTDVSLFPMLYTLAKDVDSNNVFDWSDSYSNGVDNIAPLIEVQNLDAGRYRLAIASALGCDLKMFDFSILRCGSVLLNQRFADTRVSPNDIPFVTAQSPFTDQCNLRINAPQKGYLQIVLYDLTGRPLLTKKIAVQQGSNTTSLSTPQLPAGFYVLQLANENGLPVKSLPVLKPGRK